MNNTTNTIHPIDMYYTRQMLEVAQPAYVHARFSQLSTTIPQKNSDNAKWRRWERISAVTTPITDGITPTGSTMTYTDITATVSQYGDFVTHTDQLEILEGEPTLTDTATRQGEQLADTIDQLTRNILIATTTIQYASTATTNGTVTSSMTLTTAEIRESVLTLKNNNAKPITSVIASTANYDTYGIPSCFIGIIHPYTTDTLQKESATTSEWVPVNKYPSQMMIMPNEVGSVDKVRFIETTNAYVNPGVGDSGINVYYTLILARDAYGTVEVSGATARQIIKALGSGGTNDPLNQRATQGWKTFFTAKILNNDFMVCIRHATSSG
jgi:N4-gp56 family major capsid protein